MYRERKTTEFFYNPDPPTLFLFECVERVKSKLIISLTIKINVDFLNSNLMNNFYDLLFVVLIFSGIANKHMSEMTQSFKSKAQRFASDVVSDIKSAPKQNGVSSDNSLANKDDPQAYRKESRLSEYGEILFYFFIGLIVISDCYNDIYCFNTLNEIYWDYFKIYFIF